MSALSRTVTLCESREAIPPLAAHAPLPEVTVTRGGGGFELTGGFWVPPPRMHERAQAARDKPARVYSLTCPLIQAVVTDFGRVMGVPIARFRTSCANIPSARETPNTTV